jgi:hypothetical protein
MSSRQGYGEPVVDVFVGFGRSHPNTGHEPLVGNTIHHLRNSTAFVNYGAAEAHDMYSGSNSPLCV